MGGDHVDYMALRPLQKQIGGEKAHVRIGLYLNRPTVQSPCFFCFVFKREEKQCHVSDMFCSDTYSHQQHERAFL